MQGPVLEKVVMVMGSSLCRRGKSGTVEEGPQLDSVAIVLRKRS